MNLGLEGVNKLVLTMLNADVFEMSRRRAFCELVLVFTDNITCWLLFNVLCQDVKQFRW